MSSNYYRHNPEHLLLNPSYLRLGFVERSIVRDLMDHMWLSGFGYKYPDDDKKLSRLVGVRIDRWRKIKSEILDPVGSVFDVDEGYIVSKILEKEYARKNSISLSAKKSASSRHQSNKSEPKPCHLSGDIEIPSELDLPNREGDSVIDPKEPVDSQGVLDLGVPDGNPSVATHSAQGKALQIKPTSKSKNALYIETRQLSTYCGYIPTNKFNTEGEAFIVDSDLVNLLKDTYPGVDVDEEIKKAYAWCSLEDDRRKTLRGMKQFLNRWMSRAQNSSSGQSSSGVNGAKRLPFSDKRTSPSVEEELAGMIKPEHLRDLSEGGSGRVIDGDFNVEK